MTDYFKSPYPYYYASTKKLILGLLLISIISFTFSYSFEPFDVNPDEHRVDYFIICLIHAFSPFVIGLVYFMTINAFTMDEAKWTIGKELILLGIFLFIVGVGSFLLRDVIYTNPDNSSMRYFYEEIRNTFLVGMLILFILLPLNLKMLFSKYETAAKRLSFSRKKDSAETKLFRLKTEIESEQLEFKIDDFLYAKVDGNYCFIYLKHEDSVSSSLIRITLNELEQQFKDGPNIFRCHRSYLINCDYIDAIRGNAQGYQLSLAFVNNKIPVSRSRISKFNRLFESLY